MGHAVNYGFLAATTKEEAMKEAYADACEFAYYNGDREEGSDSYDGRLRFFDKIFDTEEDALDFLNSMDTDGVVMVKEASNATKRRYAENKHKLMQKKEKYKEKVLEAFKERTSKTVSCKRCGSRFTKESAIRSKLRCPTCSNWMVSDSVKANYERITEKERLLDAQYAKSCADTGKPRYWTKYSVHC